MTTQQTKVVKSCRKGTVQRENASLVYWPKALIQIAPCGGYSGRALAEAGK